jgi:hypothetical protein
VAALRTGLDGRGAAGERAELGGFKTTSWREKAGEARRNESMNGTGFLKVNVYKSV